MGEPGSSVDLLHAIATHLRDDGPVEVGTMFRSPGLRSHGKIVAFLGHGDRLIVKLPRARADSLIADGRAEPVTMGSRTMREWVSVASDQDREATLARWTALAREALHYVREAG